MKKIIFKKLRLLNFCGIREKEIEFSEDLTTISGKNGIGKSTISRALSYVLFGTDEKGNSFDIKTYGKDHNIIREIPHEVALTLQVDAEEVELKRTLTDSWRGDKCSNTFKYYLDGEVTTAGDFKKAVNNIFYEEPFGWIINPSRFLSEDWKKQRAFLQSLIGEITTEDITKGDTKFDFVVESLKKQDIDKLIHHLRYKRNEVQKLLDEVPVRLQELSTTLPEVEDWLSLEIDINEGIKMLQSIEANIISAKTGGAAQVRNESIRKQLEFQRKRMDEMERSARNTASDETTKHQSDLLSANAAKSKANSMVEELKAKMRGFTDSEIHVKDQLEELDEKNKKGSKQYEEVSAERWQWNDNDSFCPHCGQPLPLDKLEHLKQESESRFNDNKADRLKELVALAGDIKKEKEQCQQLLEQLDKDRNGTMNQLNEAHKALKDAENHYAEISKETPRSYTAILNENENYRQACAEVKRLEDELGKPVAEDNEKSKMLDDLETQRKSLSAEVETLRNRLVKKALFDKISSRIKEVKHNKEVLQAQLDELDQKLDITNEYNQISCSILEDRVNERFKFVRWSLFKSNLDGGKKPFCECYHDGVPYSRLNGAAKVNAGIDIAYTIAQHYDVSAPMVLDECESNLHPINRGGQQIRLYVTNDQELKFDYPAKAVME